MNEFLASLYLYAAGAHFVGTFPTPLDDSWKRHNEPHTNCSASFSQVVEIKMLSPSIPHLEDGEELEGFLRDVELFYLFFGVSWKKRAALIGFALNARLEESLMLIFASVQPQGKHLSFARFCCRVREGDDYVRHHLERLRLPAFTLAALTLLLALYAFTPARTFAQTLQPQQISMTVNGQVYTVALGKTLKLPTTYADGSKGSVGFTLSVRSVLATNTAVTPNVVSCITVSATQSFYNAFGGLLAQYTISQYWCYNGTSITFYTQPSNSYSTGFGWSLANSMVTIVSHSSTLGHTSGIFRFNGPLGIGCKSGGNAIYWYGTGNYSTQFNTNSYYGC